MKIDDSLVIKYLSDNNMDEISEHWIFSKIEDGVHIFEMPDYNLKKNIIKIHREISELLMNFTPMNINICEKLFPNWRDVLENANIILAVGCPNPYDAMVREYEGEEYIIFDLVRLQNYSNNDYDVMDIVRKMVTHESVHSFLHSRYPLPKTNDYFELLKFITFDEGFAHLISYCDNVLEYDFIEIIEKYYLQSLAKLKQAFSESDLVKQKELLLDSNCGSFWDKFAAISGMLFLVKNKVKIVELYENGIDYFMDSLRV